MHKGWKQLAKSLGYSQDCIDFNILIQNLKALPKSGTQYDVAKVKKVLSKGIKVAFDELNQMRKVEGSSLESDLKKRLSQLEKWIKQIEKKAPRAVQSFEMKLRDKLSEYMSDKAEDERLLKEILLYSEKVDIAEEVTRFLSHIQQFRSFFQSKQNVVGRKMDFLTQEMVREINTIGSKSSDLTITGLVLDCKSEIEKIREQVQNIE